MRIRGFHDADLPQLIDLTIETFRPLFERHLPEAISPEVLAHDHGDWENDYRHEVPTLHDPEHDRFVILAEEEGRILGYVGWNIAPDGSGRLEMVAVHPAAQRRGIGNALCRDALDRLREPRRVGGPHRHRRRRVPCARPPAVRVARFLRIPRDGLQQGALDPRMSRSPYSSSSACISR